jgi:hypothetical protein
MTGKPRHQCAKCGRYSPADKMVFSRFTKNRYCQDDRACSARAKRRQHREVAA